MAPILSQYSVGIHGKVTPSSLRRAWIQVSCADAFAKALYSDSVLDRATVGCFFELHDSRFLTRKVQ
jgi:hypothetical protein